MKFRILAAGLMLSTVLISACGDNRVPQANQPIGSNPYYFGNGNVAGGPNGQPLGGQPFGGQPFGGQPFGGQPVGGQPVGGQPFGGQPFGGQPFGGGDYNSWYCAYDPASCYGDFYGDYNGCDGGCGNNWNAEFYFGSQVAGR